MPTNDNMYVLDTDARNHSIGAILSLIQAGEEMLAYGSKTHNRAEVNYCTIRKDLLAVVYFMKSFKQRREFPVRTDYAALFWLQGMPEMMGKYARWQELLQEFDFKMQLRLGTRYMSVDAFSIRPCWGYCLPADESAGIENESVVSMSEDTLTDKSQLTC